MFEWACSGVRSYSSDLNKVRPQRQSESRRSSTLGRGNIRSRDGDRKKAVPPP
jgi:hypothetical protein